MYIKQESHVYIGNTQKIKYKMKKKCKFSEFLIMCRSCINLHATYINNNYKKNLYAFLEQFSEEKKKKNYFQTIHLNHRTI